MSKQADEELSRIESALLLLPARDKHGSHFEFDITELAKYIQANYTPNHLVEQRCLEARIDELEQRKSDYQEYVPRGNNNPYGYQKCIPYTYIDGHIKALEAQLTNLQNKEDE